MLLLSTRLRLRVAAALIGTTLLCSTSAFGQGPPVAVLTPQQSPAPQPDPAAPVTIVLHPMAAPRPKLKYALLPPFMELTPGNAAVDYGKVTAEEPTVFSADSQNQASELTEAPLEALRSPDVESKLFPGSALKKLHRAARREHIDWQLPIRQGNLYMMLIGEAQQVRSFARLLAPRIRMHVARGEFDKAIPLLQTGYALARHVAEGETLVNQLVGMAVANMMSQQVMTFVQQPQAPNLYWAFTELPSPLIDTSRAAETERFAIELSFPELQHIEEDDWTEKYYHQFLESTLPALAELDVLPPKNPQLAFTALAVARYPLARKFLLERGYTAERLDRMPVPQTIVLYTMKYYAEVRDELFKTFRLPYWQHTRSHDAARELIQRARDEEIIPIASVLLPAVTSVREAGARTDRQIAVLRTLEAIRLYGAAHDSKLPAKLANLEVPVPKDPVTGRPFEYSLEGNTAKLTGPALSGTPLNLEIRFASE